MGAPAGDRPLVRRHLGSAQDGSIYPKYLSISVVRDEAGNATHYSGIFYDISERKTVEERLDRLAHYDVLTGLPNRSLLMDRLEQLAERSDRDGGRVGVRVPRPRPFRK